jgi:TetR/AcrR family tetracycline transcriptional repressor
MTKGARVGPRTSVRESGPGREGRLSADAVVKAALKEIDRHGLETFSLRNVAKSLNVYPTAVAWHVAGRSQLLAEVAALAMSDIAPPGFPDSWQSYLRQIFHRFRDMLRRHPNIAPLIGTQLVANRGVELDFSERLLAALAHAGFTELHLVGAYNTLIAAMVGFTTQEFAPIPERDTKTWQKDVRERLRDVSAARYPTLASNMKLLANHAFILRWENGIDAPLDKSFDIFVEVIILGLEAVLRSSHRR